MDGQMGERMERQTDGWEKKHDVWMDCLFSQTLEDQTPKIFKNQLNKEPEHEWTDRQLEGQMGGWMDGFVDG